MNQREKLVENTILALQGKLTEDVETNDINKYYRDFGNKVKLITKQLIKGAPLQMTRKKDIITIIIEQRVCINKSDCFNYIQKIAPMPEIGEVDYHWNGRTKKFIPANDNAKQAVDYVNNKYVPALKKYMDSQNNNSIKVIKDHYTDNNIKIRDFKDNGLTTSQWIRTVPLNAPDSSGIVTDIRKQWMSDYELFPYQHIYTLVIYIEDNADLNVEDNSEYRVSYNPNYNEYTVRSKKSGRVYFATNDSNEAYAELNRLNNGGSRGPELHKQGMIF